MTTIHSNRLRYNLITEDGRIVKEERITTETAIYLNELLRKAGLNDRNWLPVALKSQAAEPPMEWWQK